MISKEALASLKSEHGDVYVITAGGHEIVVRKPKRAEIKRWQDKSTSGKDGDRSKGIAATEQLVRDVLIYPPHDEYDLIVEDMPLLPMTFGGEVLQIAGAVSDVEAKKA